MRRLGDVSLRLLLLVFLLFRHFSFFFSSSSFHVGLPPFLRPFSIFAYGGISSGQLHSFSFMPVMTKETSRRLCSSDFSQPTRPRQSSGFGQARRTIDIDSVSFPSPCFPSLPSSFISGRKRKNGALLFINSVRSQKGNDASLGYLCGEGFLHGDPSTEKRIDTERARSTSRFAGRSGSSSFSSTISQTCFCPSSLIGRDRRRSRERDAFLHANFTLSFPRFFHQRLPSFLYLPFPSAVGKARLFMPKTDGYDRRDSWKPSCSFPSRTKGGELARGIPPTEARNSGERRRSGVCTPLYMTMDGDWGGGRRRKYVLSSWPCFFAFTICKTYGSAVSLVFVPKQRRGQTRVRNSLVCSFGKLGSQIGVYVHSALHRFHLTGSGRAKSHPSWLCMQPSADSLIEIDMDTYFRQTRACDDTGRR